MPSYGRARVGRKRRTRLEAELGIREGRSLKARHIKRLNAHYAARLAQFEAGLNEVLSARGDEKIWKRRALMMDLWRFRRNCRLREYRLRTRQLLLSLSTDRRLYLFV